MNSQFVYDCRIGMVGANMDHLDRIESYGIGRVELVILPREQQADVRRFLERTRCSFSVHCPLFRDAGLEGYPLLASVFDTDPDRHERSLRLMDREIRQAADIGAAHLVVHLQRSIGVLGEPPVPGWTRQRALSVAIRAGERLSCIAEECGICLHIENMMSQSLLARPEDYVALLDALPPEHVNLCLDVGHAALDAQKYGFSVVDLAHAVAPRIGSLHLYNNQIAHEFDFAVLRQEGKLRKCPLHPQQSTSEGWIDVGAVLDAVLAENPSALPTLEVYFALDLDRAGFREGLDWLAGKCEPHWA